MGIDHTGSYYAASLRYEDRYPSLGGEADTDVCVIGAGFTGICLLYTSDAADE